MRMTLVAVALSAYAVPLLAQMPDSRAERFTRNCDDHGDRRERHCEVRDATIPRPSGTLIVDGGDNGGIHLRGWDRNDIVVRALIQTSADTRAEAESIAKEITVHTDDGRIRAVGPSQRRYRHWSVSYEVWVPRSINVDADAHNGGISATDVAGRLTLHTVNGGISLRDVGGDVRAETTNGGVSAELAGTTWNGQGLDLETTNGGVTLEIPNGYNAELETGTVNGGMNIDFPITLQGRIGRRITTRLGSGGPRIRAITTNGGVRIRRL